MHHLCRVFAVSERRACRVVGQPRSTQRRTPPAQTPADPDAGLRLWLREFAAGHPRWGHRRAYWCARAAGWEVNHKKVQRLWREEGLRVPVRRHRKRAGTSSVDPVTLPAADAPNAVWAVDFQYDATTDGRPIKLLNIIDEHTREALISLVERNITAERLVAVLDHLVASRGMAPLVLRLDNGPELIATTLSDWCTGRTGMVFIPPGKPWKNPYVESFNARLRDECLNLHEFWSMAHARVVIGDWLAEYNHGRPHSALGYLAPAAYAAAITTTR